MYLYIRDSICMRHTYRGTDSKETWQKFTQVNLSFETSQKHRGICVYYNIQIYIKEIRRKHTQKRPGDQRTPGLF